MEQPCRGRSLAGGSVGSKICWIAEMLAALQLFGELSTAWLRDRPDPKLVWTAEAGWAARTENLSQDPCVGGAASWVLFFF